MILSDQDIDKARIAGVIASKALYYGKRLINPGERIVEVLDKIEEFVHAEGGMMAFPAQIALNETAAHFCPLQDDDKIFGTDDITKLDIGVHIDGIIADNALTIVFKENSAYESIDQIRKASDEALKNAINIIRPGTRLGDVGMVIQETIARFDLSPIRNLSGHGLGKYRVHTSPTVPNFDTGDSTELEENQLIAIEPFATNGNGMIYESSNPSIYSLGSLKPVRGTYTREILADIKRYNGLPFTTRWLTKKHSFAKVQFALTELRNLNILHSYPPLLEVKKGLVSQAEHTVIVREKPIITTNQQ